MKKIVAKIRYLLKTRFKYQYINPDFRQNPFVLFKIDKDDPSASVMETLGIDPKRSKQLLDELTNYIKGIDQEKISRADFLEGIFAVANHPNEAVYLAFQSGESIGEYLCPKNIIHISHAEGKK
jgi:hypothetical protein